MEARGAPDGERKTITALFADLAGFTALTRDLDPEEARALIDPALQLMMDAVHRYEGYVAQSLGDGIFALFGAPLAHEDHPQRALYAALLMQDNLRRYADRVRLDKGVPLQLRVGVNTGEVVLRSIRKDDLHTDYVPIGHTTNLASRLEGLAHPGSVVVSANTYKLVEGYFECKPLGAARIKGIDEPVPIYEILGVGPLQTKLQVAARRGLARFVGRHSELEQMRRALELAKAGHGQIVAVMGEPGVGKSRLFHEFAATSCQTPLLLCLETFSVSHGKAYPYLPLIDLLRSYFQLSLHDDDRRRREKITGKVLTLDRSLEDTLPYLFFLLGLAEATSPLQQMDPQIRRRRTFDAIKRLVLRESFNQPLVLVFEDLHWLDTETQAFLAVLSESLATAKILLLVNYRPEYHHDWGNKTYYTQLRLDPLGRAEAEEMLTALLKEKGAAQQAASLRSFILDKTEGNPFFMEEIVQKLAEQGALTPDAVGTTGRSPLPAHIHIPPTVQAVLASRIDRLPAAEKAFLQTLAVIGKEFSFSLLKQATNQPEDELHRFLSHLQTAEFIYEQPAFPEPEYVFKHALTQEVAYNSVLHERRKTLHERVAQAIEAQFHARLEDRYGDLAHHYSRSGNTQKAINYLHRAGQQAVERSANVEAIKHLNEALELLQLLPDTPQRMQQELMIQTSLGNLFMATAGFASPEVEQVYDRVYQLCQQLGETPQLFPILLGQQLFYAARGKVRTACELGERCLKIAQQVQDPTLLLGAHHALGDTVYWLGELTQARVHQERAIALYNPQQHRFLAFGQGYDPGMDALAHAAWVLWYLGYPEQALRRNQAALTLAGELAHPYSLTHALSCAAWFHQLRRESNTVRERAATAITLATEQGFAMELGWATVLQGWALAEQGHREEGMAQMHQGMAAWQASGAEIFHVWWLALLADGYRGEGKADEGMAALTEAFTRIEQTEERFYEAELYRLKGELTLQKFQVQSFKFQVPSNPQPLTPNPQAQAEAEACFLKAIDIARTQQAKSWELRATMSLTRLWQQQGKRHEAHNILAAVYNWFTEGFDTKDLQEAKALLEELNHSM
jgi:class 3 adenylate cyclase/predicted ATPase